MLSQVIAVVALVVLATGIYLMVATLFSGRTSSAD